MAKTQPPPTPPTPPIITNPAATPPAVAAAAAPPPPPPAPLRAAWCFENGVVMAADIHGEEVLECCGLDTPELRTRIRARSTSATIQHGFGAPSTRLHGPTFLARNPNLRARQIWNRVAEAGGAGARTVAQGPGGAGGAGPWDGKSLAKGQAAAVPAVVKIEAPMVRFVGPAGQRGHERRRVDVDFQPAEASAAADLAAALTLQGTLQGRDAHSPTAALRWLMRQLGEAFKEATAETEKK